MDYKKLRSKKFKFEVAPSIHINKKAHELIQLLLDMDGMITDESLLDDFLSFAGNDLSKEDLEKEHFNMTEKIYYAYGVLVPEILEGELRIWKIAQLIQVKLRGKHNKERNAEDEMNH